MNTSLRHWGRFLVAAVVAAAAPAGRADEPAVKPSAGPAVVIVGVGTFDKDKGIQPRPTAEADAKAFYKLLTDTKYFPAGPGRVKLLLSAPDKELNAEAASRDAIVKAVAGAVAETGKDDLVVLAFFGRGASAVDKTCFFTPETTFADRAKTGLLGSDLEPELKKLKGQKVLFLMDVSFKGYDAGKEKLAEPNLTDLLTGLFGGEDKEDSALPMDRAFMLASIPTVEPLTKGDHGLFASTVLDALQGKAEDEAYRDGYEGDGLVSIDELVKYLEKKMPDEARAIGKTDKEKESRPFFSGVPTSHYPITKNPALTPAVEVRLKKLDELEKDKAVTDEVAKEGHRLLARMPKLKSQQELRKAYQKLTDGAATPDQFGIARKGILDGLKIASEEVTEFTRKVNDAISSIRSVYIKDLTAGEMTAGAIRGLHRRIEAPLPPDLDEALKSAKTLSRDRQAELLSEARERLGKREDLDSGKDADVAIQMMMASFNDPYTTYIDAASKSKIESSIKGQFSGIGIRIAPDLVRDGLLVVSPIKGSPAYKAGIQAGDLITEIRRTVNPLGQPLKADEKPVISTKGLKIDEALDIILGLPDVPITVVVQREGEKEPLVKDLKRARVNVETILGTKRITAGGSKDEWDFYVDEANKIGYIHMTQFAPNTAKDLKTAVDQLKKTGLKGLVLDLRFNPGGLLRTAVTVCDLFVDDGLIVSIKPRVGQKDEYEGKSAGSETNFPMVVLVNGMSASASEIVSACLQDHGRAVVIGERSYGKGSVQNIVDLASTGGQIKLTIARYYPPSGKNIDKLATGGKPEEQWGVTPDKNFEVKLSREERADLNEHLRDLEVIGKVKDKEPKKEFKDKQLEAALEYLRGQLKAGGADGAKKDG